mgnify:CR=1 FL=1
MKLSEKHGLNPAICCCYFCGEPKNQIILTGAKGDRWAKENGFPSGEMPMHIMLAGDLEPCDKCKERGIAIAEVESNENRNLTLRRWLVKEEMVRRFLEHSPMLPEVLKQRVLVIPKVLSQKLGLVPDGEK